MTGKELLLVLVGAATAAAAGGIAATTIMNDTTSNNADQTALLDRLDKLNAGIEDTNSILETNAREISGLRGRMEAVESGLHGRRAAPLTTESGRRHVERAGSATIEEVGDGRSVDFSTSFEGAEDEMKAHMEEALKGLKASLADGSQPVRIGRILGENGEIAGITGALEGLQRSFELRALPEGERWDKAREELGLNDVQVDEIKAALEERDAAIDESMVVERDEDDGSSRISVRRMDFAKTREANEAYKKRVDNVLNDDQKKSWKDKGYENAFGRGAMGTATVISIGSITNDSSESSD
jgi:hypothetical protein